MNTSKIVRAAEDIVRRRESGPLLALVVLVIVFGTASSHLFSGQEINGVTSLSASIGIVAIGVTFLMITGEFDGISTMEDLLAFYAGLASSDKQFIVLPATAHSVIWGKNRRLFWYWMRSFLFEPAYEPV